MHRRAYRPEVPDSLEGRSLMAAGAVGPAADPIVIRPARLDGIVEQVHLAFDLYTRTRDIAQVNTLLQPVAVLIPYGREDGLGESINGILHQMRQDDVVRSNRPVLTAYRQVLAVMRADLAARIQAGYVVVR